MTASEHTGCVDQMCRSELARDAVDQVRSGCRPPQGTACTFPCMSEPDWVPPQPTRGIVGQITHHLDHLAEMLHAIDEYDELNYHHHRRIAFVDSFLLDFRALYHFLLVSR